MKIPIIGTGLSGMVGTRVIELLRDDFEFTDLSLATGVDIADIDQVMSYLESNDAKIILHMAAKTDVDGCEDDKILGEEGAAWRVNVEGTHNIAQAARKLNKRVIYISTDFVFDGTKDSYTEEDEPNPVNWYGYTKYEGENAVKKAHISYSIVRLAYPYRANFPLKLDFVRRIIEKGKKGEKIFGLTDHIFTPTFIDDIASALHILFTRDVNGIFHVVGSQSLTPYDAEKKILQEFGLHATLESTVRRDFFKDRAFRPFKLSLKNDKIRNLGLAMRSFEEGLLEMKRQMM